MYDVFYLKADLFSNDRNSVKKSLLVNARILFFYWHHPFSCISALLGLISRHSIYLSIPTRVVSPEHYLLKSPFW